MPIYRVLDGASGAVLPDAHDPELPRETLTEMFRKMVLLGVLDKILYESQRQGRISFYMQSSGEEATHIGSAAALANDDLVYAQYREAGVLLWRGFSIADYVNQCYGNVLDAGKGRQMPIHFGSEKHNFVTISSPLGECTYMQKRREDDVRSFLGSYDLYVTNSRLFAVCAL